MAEHGPLKDPWLIAAWPGMGNVAVNAAGYLVNQLNAAPISEIQPGEFFDVQAIEVRDGLATEARLPRSLIFEWRDPSGHHDLLIFLGEAQPSTGGFTLCRRLSEFAEHRGVTRLFTFAAMATQLHPSDTPRVFGVATQRDLLDEMENVGIEVLQAGQISGLNGVLLAAGRERSIPGVCLLGELPFFAAGVSNPRASHAVLELFSKLSQIEMDLTTLQEQADEMQQGLLDLLERMQRSSAGQGEGDDEEFTLPDFMKGESPGPLSLESQTPSTPDKDKPAQPKLDDETKARIESLFKQAHRDRTKAVHLKAELDRLHVFEAYENRFLDLFKKAD